VPRAAASAAPGALAPRGPTVVPQRPESGVSVRAYGAVGDGKADDSAAFAAALGASAEVFIPNGTYRVRATLALRNSQTLRGAGESRTCSTTFSSYNQFTAGY
jgi:hypothetical protein